MTAHGPRVSVGLPVYNGEPYLAEAIDSVLNQTFADFELIISDNASTDGTPRICEQYHKRDLRVRYLRNSKNRGASFNFNKVFLEAKGEYFRWIAADDVIEPTFLEKCLDALERNKDAILACTKFIRNDEFSGKLVLPDHDFNLKSPDPYRRVARLLLESSEPRPLPIWGLIRASALRASHLIRPFVGSDMCLVIELLMKGPFVQVPEYLTILRYHPRSYTAMREERPANRDELLWLDPESEAGIAVPHWRTLWETFRASFGRSSLLLPVRMVVLLGARVVPHWWKQLCVETLTSLGLRRVYKSLKRFAT